jgi:hypothetical protein
MTDQYQVASIISAALGEACAGGEGDDDPVRTAVAKHHEQTMVLAKAVLAALDKAGLEIAPKHQES